MKNNYENLKLIGMLFLIFNGLFVNLSFSQTQQYNLSRQDSAQISIYSEKSIEFKKHNKLKQESECYNKIAMIWWEHNFFSNAVDYYNKSLLINKKLANENAIAMINSNLALIHADKGEYKKSLDYFEETLNIRSIKNEKVGIIAARINMSVVLNNLKRYKESIEHLEKALDIAREMNDPVQMRSCYGMLSETYEKSGNNKMSMYYFELYREFNELVEGKKVKKAYNTANEERLKKELAEKENEIKELELIKKDFELSIKDKKLQKSEDEKLSLLDTLTHKELKIKFIENESRIQKFISDQDILEKKLLIRNIILFSSIILLLLFITLGFYFQKRKSHRILESKNEEISSKNLKIQEQKYNIEILYKETSEAHNSIKNSIDYAAFIQNAMINKTPQLKSYFPESFIYLNQKEAVGGDFYWYSKVDNKIIVAAVDCTGHGVPGAFLTVLGNNGLNNIVNVLNITDPAEITFELHKTVKSALNQDSSANKDGMDMSICTIDIDNNILHFTGANNPICIINNGKYEIIKGNKYGIGGYSDMIYERRVEVSGNVPMFDSQKIDIEKGMQLYMFSDGFQDQIGGENNKKLKSLNFYKQLLNNHTNPAKEQKEKLSTFFNEWMKKNEQLDDVVVIGIKI